MGSKNEALGYENLSHQLAIAVGTAHNSVKRLRSAGLVMGDWSVNRQALLELVVHAARYVKYVKPGTSTSGIPTADAAPPLVNLISAAELPYVWPHPEGTARGLSI